MNGVRSYIDHAAFGLEIAGVGVILVGALVASIAYLRDREGLVGGYDRYRANLGRGILLGLELLVGADIIATVSAPLTYESVGVLAAIVLIRTFLSFSLETEIKGRPPWRGGGTRDER
ncbi:DUF1622 domain-containing protein [Phenylobacterium sp.]|uniref:DUF1622 domain-containing protein n=1 Tax=Phenylobacterium sp. TaxID=1871053 RepID=UPI0035B0EAAF